MSTYVGYFLIMSCFIFSTNANMKEQRSNLNQGYNESDVEKLCYFLLIRD